jgi:hypothetical protein
MEPGLLWPGDYMLFWYCDIKTDLGAKITLQVTKDGYDLIEPSEFNFPSDNTYHHQGGQVILNIGEEEPLFKLLFASSNPVKPVYVKNASFLLKRITNMWKNTPGVSGGGTTINHANSHIRGGSDEINGDTVDINYVPTNYSPNITLGQVTSTEHLSAHLAGIDGYFDVLDGYFDVQKYSPSATDPSSPTPVEGDTYYNTDLEMMMQYDGYRSRWLSIESETLHFGRSGTTIAGGYYRGINGIVLSATRGYLASYDGTIVAMGYTRDNSDAATFEVTADGTGFSELVSTTTNGVTKTLNDDFYEDEVLAIRNKTGSNGTDYTQCWFKLRWRV